MSQLMTNPNRPPLWQAMRQAHAEDTGTVQYSNGTKPVLGEPDHTTWAAEIRAVADAIPEELYGAGGVRAWLLEEAERAEAGPCQDEDDLLNP